MNILKHDLKNIFDKKIKLKKNLSDINSNFNIFYDEKNLEKLEKLKIKGTYNLKDQLDDSNFSKFQEFLNTYNLDKNILLLIDGKNAIWEIVKRIDLSADSLINIENITSCMTLERESEQVLDFAFTYINNESLIDSDLDISKVSEMNISEMIKNSQTNYDVTEGK